jgi:amino acid transporter
MHLTTVVLVLVNCYSVRLTAYVSVVFSGLKVMAIVFIIGVGIITVMIRKSFPDQLHRPFEPMEGHEPSTASIALALYGVLWAYDGWYAISHVLKI